MHGCCLNHLEWQMQSLVLVSPRRRQPSQWSSKIGLHHSCTLPYHQMSPSVKRPLRWWPQRPQDERSTFCRLPAACPSWRSWMTMPLPSQARVPHSSWTVAAAGSRKGRTRSRRLLVRAIGKPAEEASTGIDTAAVVAAVGAATGAAASAAAEQKSHSSALPPPGYL